MNKGFKLACIAGLSSFLIIGLCHDLLPPTESGKSHRYEKPILKKTPGQNTAAGQSSPSSYGDEIEFETNNGMVYVYVNNRLAGPLQVQLSAGSSTQNMDALPALPVTYLLEAKKRVLLTRLQAIDNGAPMIRDLRSLRVPGDPHAIPDEVTYSLPIDETSHWELGQEFNGEYSHHDEQNRYALDFIVPVGTPVLAARAGVVMETIANYEGSGQNAKIYATRANFIRILHDDGSMALYAHLKENGVLVSTGQRVGLGEPIGYSGNTGFSSGPHLHFALQINTGMRLVSIPFQMVGPQGFLPLSK
jgi:murein DD-endopeptidase MepM/ murein hydrolase activator NlpD